MGLFSRNLAIPTSEEALPGRAESMPIPSAISLAASLSSALFRVASNKSNSAWAVFGAQSENFGNCRAFIQQQQVMPAVTHPTQPMRRSAPDKPATPKLFWWFGTPLP